MLMPPLQPQYGTCLLCRQSKARLGIDEGNGINPGGAIQAIDFGEETGPGEATA